MLPESGAMSSPHALAPLSQADTNTYAVFTSQPQLIGQATSACATAPSTASYGPLAICSQPGPPNPAVTMGNPVTGHSEFLGPTHGVELGMHAPCSIANAFSPGLLFGGETAAAAAAEYMNFPAAAAPPQHLNNFGGHLHQQTMPGLTSNLLGNYNAPASGSAFCSSGLPHLDTNQYGANNFLLEPPGAWGHQVRLQDFLPIVIGLNSLPAKEGKGHDHDLFLPWLVSHPNPILCIFPAYSAIQRSKAASELITLQTAIVACICNFFKGMPIQADHHGLWNTTCPPLRAP